MDMCFWKEVHRIIYMFIFYCNDHRLQPLQRGLFCVPRRMTVTTKQCNITSSYPAEMLLVFAAKGGEGVQVHKQ